MSASAVIHQTAKAFQDRTIIFDTTLRERGEMLERAAELHDEAIAAITLYGQWEDATKDYPHDERGCEAHEAILNVYRRVVSAEAAILDSLGAPPAGGLQEKGE